MTGLVAPEVLDRTINGGGFEACLGGFLPPDLRLGDITERSFAQEVLRPAAEHVCFG